MTRATPADRQRRRPPEAASVRRAGAATSTRRVVVVAFPGVQGLDVVGPFEVFAGATQVVASTRPDAPPAYELSVVSTTGGSVCTETGLPLGTDALPDLRDGPATRIDTLVIAGGFGVQRARRDTELVVWIRAAAASARRVATVCTGSFLAAEAGLLADQTVTTHWARAAQLAREFPGLDVDPDPIYTRAGDTWTSAGVTAGIDMALAMVEDDLGTEVAQTVARWLVMFLRRPGGQTQEHARRMLEDGDDTVAAIAARCGFGTSETMRRAFVRRVGVAPDHYRRRFRHVA